MCGIAGIICFKSPGINIGERLELMLREIQHRGPDDEGILLHTQEGTEIFYTDDSTEFKSSLPYAPKKHFKENTSNNAHIALGHRRLSIIDISADGHQPMCDPTGRFWMVYNGEIYNYKELKKELEGKGVEFRSKTDSEVLLNAYIQWGEDCVKKFNGMWSFLIFDNFTGEIFVARDRLGIKPFNYYKNDSHIVFCSEIKGIIASKLYKPEINYEGLWYNLAQGIAPRPMTCFKGIKSLKPGHYMKITKSGDCIETKYWDLPLDAPKDIVDEEEAIERLRSLIEQSIKYRMISDVKVGSFLSGGVDSGIVTSIASAFLPNISGYTIGFEEEAELELNEIVAAKRVAEKHQIEHVSRVVTSKNMLDHIYNMVNCFEEPYLSLAPPFLAAELAHDNKAKVLLYGMGGDEFFGGYRYYKRIPLWHLTQKNKSLLNLLPKGVSGKIDRLKDIQSCANVWEYYSLHHTNITDNEKNKLFKSDEYITAEGYKKLYNSELFENAPTFDQLSYIDAKTYLGSHQLNRNDQFAMFFSLEGRFPFLDHRLVETAFRIPEQLKIKQQQTKYLLKKIAENYLPKDQIYQKKKGFSLPMNTWCNTSFKDLIHDSCNKLKSRSIFNNEEIDLLINSDNWQKKWHLVMTELWLQRFMDN